MKLLKIPSAEVLGEFFKWKSMSKVDKIESLIPKISSPRDFLNMVYTHYRKHKANHKASWKKLKAKEHLLKIKQIADTCIVKDEMSLADAKEIAMRAYFAMWCAIAAAPAETANIIPLKIQRKQEVELAAAWTKGAK